MLSMHLLVGLIVIALAFDFLNGLHDAANSVATIVSPRVLSPVVADETAAIFHFVACLVFGLHVANTMGKGIIDANIVDPQVIFGALIGAIFWNVLTWIYGIPSSSSHALIGGLVGAGIAKAGFGAVIWSGLGTVALFIVSAWASVRSTPFAADWRFRVLQFISSSLFSLGHGGNDAQKTMGIIAILLYSQGHMPEGFHVPFWVVITCQAAMSHGTLCGGWRIVKTVGSKNTA